MLLFSYFFKVVHQRSSQALLSKVRVNSDSTHMPMPCLSFIIESISLNFSKQISLDFPKGVCDTDAILLPLDEVLSIELGVEGLSEDIEIDVVILQLIKHRKWTNRTH